MTILKFPKKQPEPPFFKDIVKEGYHIFSLKNAKIPDFYPNEFPDYSGISLKDLIVDDVITIRVFFRVGSGKDIRVEIEYLDLEVELVGDNSVLAVILTELPDYFSLKTGETIEVFEDEILYKTDEQEN